MASMRAFEVGTTIMLLKRGR